MAVRGKMIVRSQEFHRKPKEDPKTWYNNFIMDVTVNGWDEDQLLNIAAGFFKEAAKEWYINIRDDLQYLKDNTDATYRTTSLYY